jgi:cation diffusion facilitator family transporter
MSEKIQIARTSAIVGGLLALLKIGVGIFSGSLALVSEGIHSSLDFLVTLATWVSVKNADVPADREHHYGHGKIENLTAFAQALLLLITGLWIIMQAINHLRGHQHPPIDYRWGLAVAVICLSIVVDLSRSRALSKAAKKFNSQALEADALHFGTELLSSLAVLLSLLLTRIGGEKFWMADPIAAIVVAIIMLITSARLGRRSADILIDRAPPGLEEEIHDMIEKVGGVREVSRIRARQSGAHTFVDATISVDPGIALAAGHEIADNAELRVTEKYPAIDILIHVEPAPPQESPDFIIRQAAEEMKIELHAIRIREIEGQMYINFHAELPPDMTLAAAHARVDELEEAIRSKLPGVADITSHIEPKKP